MAKLISTFWRDIPALVIGRVGRDNHKQELQPRFAAAIDRAAMRAGKVSSDAYLAEWRRSDATPCGDDIEQEAAAEAARVEAKYSDQDLERLIRAKGVDETRTDPQPPSAG